MHEFVQSNECEGCEAEDDAMTDDEYETLHRLLDGEPENEPGGKIVEQVEAMVGRLRDENERLRGMFRTDGRVCSGAEAREILFDHLSQGRRVLPMGEPCEGFSYETGCPGHQVSR